MNKMNQNDKQLKKLSLADLEKVVGGLPPDPKVKITVENGSGTSKASGEG